MIDAKQVSKAIAYIYVNLAGLLLIGIIAFLWEFPWQFAPLVIGASMLVDLIRTVLYWYFTK